MAKETYYFSHDYDPLGDPKMQAMVSEFGGMGYGIFWRIAEMLHADATHKLALKPYVFKAIANQMKTDPEFVENFINRSINEFELFASDASFLWSHRVIRNIDEKGSKRSKKSEAGKKGGISSGESRRTKQTEAMLQKNEPSPSNDEANEPKERKGKEIEEEKQKEELLLREKEKLLCPKMVGIFKSVYPKYPSNQEADYPACLQIAHKIADSKGWKKETVTNGRLDDVLGIWKFMVDFSAVDPWFSTRSISDFNKEFQRLVQKITNKKTESTSQQRQEAPPLKKLRP